MIVTLANGDRLDTSKPASDKVKKPKSKNGFILYQGPSVLDGEPIVCIATLKTANKKVGNMIQTWILRSDVDPSSASRNFQDSSICGQCPERRNLGGACYVLLYQAPRAVYNSFKKEAYEVYNPTLHASLFADRQLRIGSYGDPAAVPAGVWLDLIGLVKGYTAYTHQLHHANFDPRLAEFCMISTETTRDSKRCQDLGYKTFRLKTENMSLMDNEILCVNSSHNLTCEQCGICNGKQCNVAIDAHGTVNARFKNKFERII